ncbi:GrpB family protein [Rhizobium ruizarguesonis]|nr:GrpB family protein [Rhizobium ruizarguesonis]
MKSNEPIEICDWSAEWAEKFRVMAAVIRTALGARAKRVKRSEELTPLPN